MCLAVKLPRCWRFMEVIYHLGKYQKQSKTRPFENIESTQNFLHILLLLSLQLGSNWWFMFGSTKLWIGNDIATIVFFAMFDKCCCQVLHGGWCE